MTAAKPRVLLVLPNWLGDLVMSLPMVDVVRSVAMPAGWDVRVALRRRWAPLLGGDPRASGALLYERNGRHAGPAGMVRLAADWRRLGPRAIVLGPPSLRVSLAAAAARIPVRVGVAADGRAPLLSHVQPPVRPRGRAHYIDEMMALGRTVLAAVELDPAPAVPPAHPVLPALASRPPTDLGDGPPAWILAPGATYGPAKTWPGERVRDFLEIVVRDQKRRVLLVGDHQARVFCDELRSDSDLPWRRDIPGPAGVVDLVAQTDLDRVVGLLGAAEAFVGNDSGLMHLAAALGRPTVGIFGSSSPAWTAPRGPRAEAVAAVGFPCHPCFRKTCNQERFCLETVTAVAVFEAIESLRSVTREART